MVSLIGVVIFLGALLGGFKSRESFRQLLTLIPFFLPLYVARLSVGPLPTTYLELFLLGVFASSLRYIKISDVKNLFQKRDILFLTIILVLSFSQIFVASDIVSSLGIWRAFFLEPILFYGLIRVFLRGEDFRQLKNNLFATGVILAAIGILQFLTRAGLPTPWDIERRITSIFPYPNALGLFLAPVFGLAVFDKELSKFKKAFFAILFLLAIYLAKTEAALVAIAASSIVISFIRFKNKRLLIGFVAVIAVLMAVLVQPLREKLLLQDYSGVVRRSQWSETVEMLKDSPVLGAGVGGYEQAFLPYHTNKDIEIFAYPHNWFLNVWSELGIAGLSAFLAMVVLFIAKLPELTKKAPGETLALLIILIHGLVDVPFFKNDLAILSLIIVFLCVKFSERKG